MRVVVVACVVAGCGGAPAPRVPSPPPAARIEVTSTACPDGGQATERIRAVLAAHGAERADLVIRVDSVAREDATDVRVLVTRSRGGDAGLDRTYTLGASDCPSAPELVALGVDRFLTSFPDWAGPAPPPPAPPARWVEASVIGAVNAIWMPLGVDAQVGGLVDVGAERHRLGGTLLVRASIPQAAGSGSFQQTAVLAGAAYRWRSGAWAVRGELRGGALLVSGIGLSENDRDWLPWWEGAVFGGRAFRWGSVGVELAATALRHHAVTRDGLIREDIPLLRLGVAGEFGVRSRKP